MRGKNRTKKKNKRVAIVLTVTLIFIAIIGAGAYVTFFQDRFQDVTIEIGTNLPEKKQFLLNQEYETDTEVLTDLSQIDINKVGSYDVQLSYKGKTQVVTLNLVDTTCPEVTFQDVFKNVNYEINPEDFVKEKKDLSEMTVELETIPDISEYGEYKVNVIVKDSSRK